MPESLAQEIHSSPKKPFSIRKFQVKEKTFTLELSVLEDRLYSALLHEYYISKDLPRLKGVVAEPIRQKSVEQKQAKSYQEILETPAHKKISIEFITPSAFNRFGADYPIPEPQLVFLNLLHRWNSFSHSPLELKEEEIMKSVIVQSIEGRTERFQIDEKLKRAGFLGKVEYLVKDQELAKKLSVLSAFSVFSGIGIKTTMGMGAVKVSLRLPIQK